MTTSYQKLREHLYNIDCSAISDDYEIYLVFFSDEYIYFGTSTDTSITFNCDDEIEFNVEDTGNINITIDGEERTFTPYTICKG